MAGQHSHSRGDTNASTEPHTYQTRYNNGYQQRGADLVRHAVISNAASRRRPAAVSFAPNGTSVTTKQTLVGEVETHPHTTDYMHRSHPPVEPLRDYGRHYDTTEHCHSHHHDKYDHSNGNGDYNTNDHYPSTDLAVEYLKATNDIGTALREYLKDVAEHKPEGSGTVGTEAFGTVASYSKPKPPFKVSVPSGSRKEIACVINAIDDREGVTRYEDSPAMSRPVLARSLTPDSTIERPGGQKINKPEGSATKGTEAFGMVEARYYKPKPPFRISVPSGPRKEIAFVINAVDDREGVIR